MIEKCEVYTEWCNLFDEYRKVYPDMAKLWDDNVLRFNQTSISDDYVEPMKKL